MVDPSLLFSEGGTDWLRLSFENEVKVFTPRVVTEWLRGEVNLDPILLLADKDAEVLDQRLEEVRALGFDRLIAFDHRQASIDEEAGEVLDALNASESLVASVWADEWAYLQSNSWLSSKLRRCLDAFETAGAVVFEFGVEQGIALIEEVIPADHIPQSINAEVILRAAAKWTVIGGVTAAGGTLGGVAGTHVAGPIGGVIAGKLASAAGRKATTKVLFAIDP